MVSILQPSLGGVSSEPQAAAATASSIMPSENRRRNDGSKAVAPPAPPRAEMTATTTAMQADDDLDDADADSSSSSDDDASAAAEQPLPPFYDPRADSEDEAYLNERSATRALGRGDEGERGRGGAEAPLPSDACLSCPGCFSTLTRLSQRHASDPGVWRSIYVEEDSVSVVGGASGAAREAARGRAPAASATGGKKRGRGVVGAVGGAGDSAPEPTSPLRRFCGGDEIVSQEQEEQLPRVACSSCDEIVGCLEEDGVFIFFNVIPSA